MESARRIGWGKGRRVWHRFFCEKSRIGVQVLMGISETCQNREVLQRHPKQVGIKQILLDLGHSGQIDESMVTLTKRRDRLSECGIATAYRRCVTQRDRFVMSCTSSQR